MPHLFSGLNQKRQGGKITNGTLIVGSKGRGSATRMVSNCKSNSENSSDCINSFITKESNPTPIEEDILFNISSFNKFSIQQPYLDQLIKSAQRWNKYLKINKEVIQLIRQYTKSNNWSGIEMDNFTLYDSINPNDNIFGLTYTRYAKQNTSLVKSFVLFINQKVFNARPDMEQLDIMTHELGHALGLCNNYVKENGSGQELLPNVVKMLEYTDNAVPPNSPYGLTKQYFPRLNKAYNLYGGMVDSESKQLDSDIIPTYKNWNHIPGTGISTTKRTPHPPYPYMKKGFLNEIMIPTSTYQKLYISEISLGYLLDLYSNLNNINYYTYERKVNTSEVNKHDSSYSLIEFNKTKEFNVTKEFNEHEKDFKLIRAYLCGTCMEELP